MNVYEMEGFLRGKCLPGDLLVGESHAEYLVRKLNEATAAKDERDALADKCVRLEYINEQTLQVKLQMNDTIKKQFDRVNALAVENAALKEAGNKMFLSAIGLMEDPELEIDHARDIKDWERKETPATDAALAAIEARGVEKALAVVSACRENICPGGLSENRQYEESIVQPHLDGIADELENLIIELREAK